MITELVITFRETLEAALIVGIILAYLHRTGNFRYEKHVWLGVGAGIVGSLVGAFFFPAIESLMPKELFEGLIMVVASVMVTWMILWMLKQRHVRAEIERKVKMELDEKRAVGLAFFVFLSVFREGIETVLFLGAAAFAGSSLSLLGALAGMAGAVFLAFLLFETTMKINMKLFFNITSVILILFAAGLVSHAVKEFQEAKVLPAQEPIWDTTTILDDKSPAGAIPRALFGYRAKPTPMMVGAYLLYLLGVYAAYRNIERLHKEVI